MFNAFQENLEDIDNLINQALKSIGKFSQNEFNMDDMVDIVNWINNYRDQTV